MTTIQPSSPKQIASKGTVLSVEHVPTAHGDKIHTRILLKGHPLPALWRSADLHHTISPELHWDADICIYCQQCRQVCPKGCLHLADDILQIDRANCDACGDCVKECPSKALEMVGSRTTAGDLLHKTLKQNYETARKICQISITGGEPGLQPAFCADLLFQIEAAGIPVILDTSGLASFDDLLPLLSSPQQINFELITSYNELHTLLTGYGNALILDNLVKVCNEVSPLTKLVVRTPLIRGKTAAEDEIHQTGFWLATHVMPDCHMWELFEPTILCEEHLPFSDQNWAGFQDWAKWSGFPEERIQLIDKNGILR